MQTMFFDYNAIKLEIHIKKYNLAYLKILK